MRHHWASHRRQVHGEPHCGQSHSTTLLVVVHLSHGCVAVWLPVADGAQGFESVLVSPTSRSSGGESSLGRVFFLPRRPWRFSVLSSDLFDVSSCLCAESSVAVSVFSFSSRLVSFFLSSGFSLRRSISFLSMMICASKSCLRSSVFTSEASVFTSELPLRLVLWLLRLRVVFL